ncbi:MAG: alpha/beta fold hydrolase [Propionivibrio sp.]
MNTAKHSTFPEVGVPFLWPLEVLSELAKSEADLLTRQAKFQTEIQKTQIERPDPTWATPNRVVTELHTSRLRSFDEGGQSASTGTATLVLAPYAGHTSTIADFARGQSLVETLVKHGVHRVHVTDWKSASSDMRDYDIDNYLADLNVCVDDIGGRVHLIGLCQGGWLAAMYAARFPGKTVSLTLAGSPIDTDAGTSEIKNYAHELPLSFFEELVALGDGVLQGRFMLGGFKNMHPEKQYFDKYVDLYEHVDEPAYVARFEQFERWYEKTIDLPGRWYLQAISQLFKENRFFKGEFVGLGRRLDLRSVQCPVYLLAGKEDDITPADQVFNAAQRLGTAPGSIVKDLAAGGHIGLFMGRTALERNWTKIARWILDVERTA